MFQSKPTVVPITAILLVLLPVVSGIPFKNLVASNGLNAFRVITNSLRSQQQLSVVRNDTGRSPLTSCPDNLTAVLRECYRSYLQVYNLGIDSSGKLPPFMHYIWGAVNSNESFQVACRAYNDLHNCIKVPIAPSSIPDCMNGRKLETLALDYGDAVKYSVDFAVSESMCGESFIVFDEDYHCIYGAGNIIRILVEMEQCEIREQVVSAGVCSAFVIATRCARQACSATCGTATGEAMCKAKVNVARYLPNIIDSTCFERVQAECGFNYGSNNVTTTSTQYQIQLGTLQTSTPLQHP